MDQRGLGKTQFNPAIRSRIEDAAKIALRLGLDFAGKRPERRGAEAEHRSLEFYAIYQSSLLRTLNNNALQFWRTEYLHISILAASERSCVMSESSHVDHCRIGIAVGEAQKQHCRHQRFATSSTNHHYYLGDEL
jgi:hypothetical protein